MKKVTILAMLLLWVPVVLFSQNSLGKFTGTVSDRNNNEQALVGATVVVKNESTGFQAGTVTDAKGNYFLDELPLGGPYTITISFVGYSEKSFQGYMLNMRDHIILPDISLSTESTELDAVVVSGFSYKASRDQLGTATRINAETMTKMPTASRNYEELAKLSPLTRGTNIAGARGNMRGLTLDGVSNRMHMFGSTSEGAFPVSLETIREFEVVTNTYGVADGRGGAGTIKAVTKSGTNNFEASAWTYYTGGDLAGVEVNKDGEDWKKGEKGEYTNSQYGLNVGGPIIKDKLHFFLSYDRFVQAVPWRAWDFESAGASLADGENNLGITQANMNVLTSHLVSEFGVPDVQQYGTMDILRTTDNAFLRLDYTINDKHRLVGRYNYHLYIQPGKKASNGLFSTQYKGRQQDHTFYANLQSRISHTMRNDLKFSYMNFKRTGDNVYGRVPVGVVKVASTLPNGEDDEVTVRFGNQYWAPEIISSNDFQLIDNFTFVSGKSRWLLGTDIQFNMVHDLLTHYQQGEFVYYSLDNLLANSPDEYNRKVPITDEAGEFVNPKIFTFGLYGENTWSPNRDLEITAGLRWDMTYLPEKPNADPLLERELGLKSDVAPFDADNIQPRFNITWDVNGNHADILKFGFGWFVSEFTSQAMSFALINNAGNFKSVSARKTDGNMPTSDWRSYYQSFDNVPGYDNWLSTSGINLAAIPNSIHILDENLETPMTFKTHVSYSKFFADNFVLTGGFYFNRTSDQYMMQNMNIKDNPEFYVAAENNRGIFVDPSLVRSNGLADYNNARKSESFNEVMMFTNANWAKTSWYALIEAAYKVRDGELKASYTYGQSKGGVRYNSGNPKDKFYTTTSYNSYIDNAADWYDDDDMRHKIVTSILSPSYKGFSLNVNMIFYQWDRFHSTVNRDQNGDDTPYSDNEDLSFIFDPATAPAEIREDLNYVWANTSEPYREYLNEYKGTFSAQYGGLQPWRYEADLSLVKNIQFANKNNLEVRLDIFNFLNLINYQWGGYHYVSNTRLYNVTGFDEATKTYSYDVNKEAGKMRYRVSSSDLYQIQLGLKYRFK